MQNFVKTLTVSHLFKLLLFIFLSNSATANEIIKKEYSNTSCLQLLNFRECTFKDGLIIIGNIDDQGKWNKNIKDIKKNNLVSYLYYRSGAIAYGVISYDNGYYVGDLDSNANRFGFGSYYFSDGYKYSFQDWQNEIKTGYIEYSNGKKEIGKFDKKLNLLRSVPLSSNFQIKLNNMELLAQNVKFDFKKKYSKFLIKKKKYQSNQSNKSSNNISNINKLEAYQNQIIYISIGIIFFIFAFLWKHGNSSNKTKINVTENKTKKNKKDVVFLDEKNRYRDLSLADSKKLFSYGVKEFMSVPEAFKQLRSEYFKWSTVSNNRQILKKVQAQKNMNKIIELRKKLEC